MNLNEYLEECEEYGYYVFICPDCGEEASLEADADHTCACGYHQEPLI